MSKGEVAGKNLVRVKAEHAGIADSSEQWDGGWLAVWLARSAAQSALCMRGHGSCAGGFYLLYLLARETAGKPTPLHAALEPHALPNLVI